MKREDKRLETESGSLDAEVFVVLQKIGWISVDAECAGT
jgi:hypothetical protein